VLDPERFAGVDPDPDLERAGGECALGLGGGGEGFSRAAEGREEGVALGTELDTAVRGEGPPQRPPVVGKGSIEALLAQLLQ